MFVDVHFKLVLGFKCVFTQRTFRRTPLSITVFALMLGVDVFIKNNSLFTVILALGTIELMFLSGAVAYVFYFRDSIMAWYQ